MNRQQFLSTAAQVALALAAVIGLSGAGIHYVAAQTGEVRLQATKLELVSSQIPLIWAEVQMQGTELQKQGAELTALRTAVLRNQELLEASEARQAELLEVLRVLATK